MDLSGGEKRWLTGLFAGLFVLYAILPSVGGSVFASPDETAAAVAARQIAETGHAYLTIHSSTVPSSLSKDDSRFPAQRDPVTRDTIHALHPRSWVTLEDKIAPVGFLGWPWVLSFFYRVGGSWILPWIGMLVILSSAWPFFCLLRRFGFWSAWVGTLIAFTFPSVILYANRSLFTNAIVLALGIWMLWLIRRLSEPSPYEGELERAGELQRVRWFVVGLIAALAISVRPTEAVWLVPWWVWAGWHLRPTRRQWIALAIGALLVFVPLVLLAHDAYGSWFTFGYRLQDVIKNTEYRIQNTDSASSVARLSFLPYGFHLRNLLRNVWEFLIGLLWPWMIVAGFAVWSFVAQTRRRITHYALHITSVFLAAWTIFVLFLFYGSGIYADNVTGVATIGNSFLRYFLPIAPLVGWAAAYLWHEVERGRFAGAFRFCTTRQAAIVIAIFLSAFGIYRAVWADNESLITTRGELVGYLAIRQAATEWFQPNDVIVSDRSDKIFFPTFLAASPIPSPWLLTELARSASTQVGLFARPLSQQQKDAWLQAGLEPQELVSFAREKLYRVVPR